ncbi:Disulfide bond reductase DsbH precursor [compost metagenome]
MSTFISGLLSLILLMAPADKQPLNRFTEQAVKEHKYIAVYFSGSDWCSHCHYFNNHILQQDSVQQLLNKHYIYYNADFPQRKKLPPEDKQLNDAWAEALNPEGAFPLFVICDEQLQIKSRITRSHTIEAVTDTLQKYSNR